MHRPTVSISSLGLGLLLAMSGAAGCAHTEASRPTPTPAAEGRTASAEPPASARDAQPFEGCEISEQSPGARQIKCRDVIVMAGPIPDARLGEEGSLEAAVLGMAHASKGGFEHETVQGTIGGQKRLLVRFVETQAQADGHKKQRRGWLAVVPGPGPDTFRLFMCTGPAKHEGLTVRCQGVFDALAAALPPPDPGRAAPSGDPAKVEARSTFAGRDLAVPEDCELVENAHIRCPTSRLTWLPLTKQTPPIVGMVKALKTGLNRYGDVTESERACTIEDTPARCRVLEIKPKDGSSPFHMVIATGMPRGQWVLVECLTRISRAEPLAAPCDQVLHLK